MRQMSDTAEKRRGFSLSLLISLGLVMAAIIPLLITLAYIYTQTQPTLINQANKAMTSDAQTRVQIIDTYFHERLLDAKTLTQVTSVQTFLAYPLTEAQTPMYILGEAHVGYALQAGLDHNSDYANWALFDIHGQLRMTEPLNRALPKRGKSYFTQEQLQAVKAGKEFISPVYYNTSTHIASVDMFAPVIPLNPTTGKPLPPSGFMRATLNLNTIQTLIEGDTNVQGRGSYAFILDNQGVSIADANPQRLFTTVQDHAIAAARQHTTGNETFQGQLGNSADTYQIVRQATREVPWQYFEVSPVSTVTATAHDQIFSIFILAIVASLIVTIAGIFFGRGISRPILLAVERLRENSEALSGLSSSQQDAANEQVWVVDSSQVGLQSVQYYTDATKTAASQLRTAAQELRAALPHTIAFPVDQTISLIYEATNYIDRATELQNSSNQKLATALKVATQVTEQLHTGANSAAEASTHLEEVVQELRSVVGR